jgi:hypothetical protein
MRHDQLLFAGLFTPALLFSSICMAQNSPNAEDCLSKTWGYLKSQGYEYSAINACAYPVAVSMMTGTKKLIEQTVQPGQAFRTGLTLENFEASRKKSGWIATVCKSGEAPTLNVSGANDWSSILKGNYECRKP